MVVRQYFATRTKAYEEWTHERQKGGDGVPLTERGEGERGEGGRRPPEAAEAGGVKAGVEAGAEAGEAGGEAGEAVVAGWGWGGGRLGWWPVVSLGGVTRWPRFRCRGSGSHVAHVARGGG